jgi:hypothetical protein
MLDVMVGIGGNAEQNRKAYGQNATLHRTPPGPEQDNHFK